MKLLQFLIGLFILVFGQNIFAQKLHLCLTEADTKEIKSCLGKYQIFDKSYQEIKKIADDALKSPLDVPVPKDQAGGYTHEQHKKNYYALQAAGLVFAIERKAEYKIFVRKMLLKYAELIPTLSNHPYAKGSSPGRLFHQALNDCNWIVYSIQGYDCVRETLSETDQKKIENGVFRPLCNFLTKDLQSWFDLIHNHGVWANAAVGMVGYEIGDRDFVDKALYGSKKDKKSGFLAQIENLLSPDGYYVEGPYYARYALFPIMVFASVIQKNDPALQIFEFRDKILKKATYATLQQTYTNGEFFPVNDAMKDKTWTTRELISSISILVENYGVDPHLLSVIKEQKRVMVSTGGVKMARLMSITPQLPAFDWKSVSLSDGNDGNKGGLSILRKGKHDDQFCSVFKYTSHGLSHGHYDKLNILLYDQGREILTDYGAARFLNVEPKFGGRYLPENDSYATQTISHNTLTIDENSQYQGKEEVAQNFSPKLIFSDFKNPNYQVVSAIDTSAYKGVRMQRTLIVFQDSTLKKPIMVDVMKVISEKTHQYDLSYHYDGHLIATNYPYQAFVTTLSPLGKRAGYQHLWKESEGKSKKGLASLTFINNKRFYTIATITDTSTNLLMARSGANDPNYNLRHEPAWIVRKNGVNKTFVSTIEPHGFYDGTLETSSGAASQINFISIVYEADDQMVIKIDGSDNRSWVIGISGFAFINSKKRTFVQNQAFEWEGFSQLISLKK